MEIRDIREMASNDAYNELLRKWATDESQATYEYPDYYGGAYINSDGILTIYTTGVEQQEVNRSIVETTKTDNIIFKESKYSYRELKKAISIIEEYVKSKPKEGPVVLKWGICDNKNNILIGLEDDSPEKIEEFKKNVVDLPFIEFNKTKPITLCYLNPGRRVYGNAQLSAGYRVRRGGVDGIVTAAHGINQGQSLRLSSASGTILGDCTHRVASGNTDAAFCRITHGSYPPSNTTLYGNVSLQLSISTPAVGTTITFEGAITGAARSASVSRASVGATIVDLPGVILADLIETSSSSSSQYPQQGDSGGPAYNSSRNPVGIVTGNNYESGKYFGYFTKATNINNNLATSRY